MTLTEFERFANENNIVPVSTKIYSQMISDSVKYAKMKEVLQEIRQEIDEQTEIHADGEFYIKNYDVKRIIDKHIKEIEG